MSDSDSDDLYSNNYTFKRVAAHAKRKQKELSKVSSFVRDGSNDEAEEVVPVESNQINKRRKIIELSDDDENDEETSEKFQTHDEYIEELSKKKAAESCRVMKKSAEQEYVVGKYQTSKTKVQTEIGQFNRAKKIFEELDEAEKMSDLHVFDNEEFNESLTSSLPVTIDVMDLEMIRNGIFKIDIQLDQDFSTIRKRIAEAWGMNDTSDVLLHHNGKLVDNFDTPKSLGFEVLQVPHPVFEASKHYVAPEGQTNNHVIQIDEFDEIREIVVEPNSELNIKFQIEDRRKPIEIQTSGSATVDELKNLFFEELGEDVDKDKIRLMFDDEYLTDGTKTCDNIGIEDGDCIDVYY